MKKTKKNKVKVGQKLISLFILAGIVVVISLKLYQSFKVDLLMKDLQHLDQNKKRLLNENAQLQADVDRLSNIDVIMRKAERDFGMIRNTEEMEVLLLGDEDDLRELQKRFAVRTKESETFKMAGVH